MFSPAEHAAAGASNEPEAPLSIKSCLFSLLESPAVLPAYRQAMRHVLSRDQSLCAAEEVPGAWSRGELTLAIFRSASGPSPDQAAARSRAAVLLGAAVHLLYLVSDVLDDVEDGDYTDAGLAMPLALNASTGLLFLAQHALLSIPGTVVAATRLVEAVRRFNLELVRVCSGQHEDLQSSSCDDSMSEERCLAVAEAKNSAMHGTFYALAATLASDNQELAGLFRAFGSKLGLALQLHNDLHDILSPQSKQDLAAGKATLPLVYSLAQAEYGPQVRRLLQELTERPPAQGVLDQVVKLIWQAGGIHYTWVQSQLAGMEACEIVKQLERHCTLDAYVYRVIQLYQVQEEELAGLLA